MSQPSTDRADLDYWQLASQLEAGRAEVLRRVAKGDSIDSILNLLCKNSERYNPAMKSSVLRLNAKAGTLHPVASVSLPEAYCAALDGVKMGIGVGSCGTAAFSKKRVIVSDINNHPYWDQYKGLALAYQLRACWSEPIIGSDGNVFGTFAMYYSEPTSPSAEDLDFIETCANLAAIVFDNHMNRQQLLDANQQLNQSLDQKTSQLKQANRELSALIEQQVIDSQQHLHSEKAVTTQMLLMGFAHEVNTPLGIALTAISHCDVLIDELLENINQDRLSKLGAIQNLSSLKDATQLSLKNLERTSDLIERFREIDSRVFQERNITFSVAVLLAEMQQHLALVSPDFEVEIEADAQIQTHSKMALRTIFNHLIENSIVHGFADRKQGRISIFVSQSERAIHISYQDDGCGITSIESEKVFEPFYSTMRSHGQLGLGLNVINNILLDVYQGKIDFVASPVGVRYQIHLPL